MLITTSGVLCYATNRKHEAQQAFERTVAIDAAHAEAQANLGALLQEQGKTQQAMERFTIAVNLRPDNRVARFHLGRIYGNQRRYDEAPAEFSRILTPEDDATPTYLYAMGATYARAGRLNKATATLDRASLKALERGQTTVAQTIDRDRARLTGDVAGALFGGWQINATISAVSGNPFSVVSDGSSLNAPGNTQTADQINLDLARLEGVGTGAPYYDTPAFRAPTGPPRLGSMGLYNIRAPGFFNMNSGLFRSFKATERFNVQFRAEGLNVTNTPQLQNPNSTVTNPSNFMAITAANQTQRTIRLGLRLAF